MTQGYHALTEKEKETLRLLLNGYDAKSMARHLGLSVHTVNERLRDARRKMAVSSSREAARQLREAERAAPELLGDKALGDASASTGAARQGHQAERAGIKSRTGWVTGGIAMSLALALYALAALSGGAQPTPASPPAASAAEVAAVASARQFLELLDARDWQGSWNATGRAFRAANTVEKWTEASNRVRQPLGAMLSRELLTVDYAPAPPHGYWIIKFRTSYANKADAIETLSLAWEDGSWKVAGITIG